MKKMNKLLCVLLAIMLLFLTTACEYEKAVDIEKNGEEKFGAGITEISYPINHLDEWLDNLMKDFSDGVSTPEAKELTEDEVDKWQPDPTPPPKPEDADQLQRDASGNFIVRNQEDLYKCLNYTWANTLTTCSFTLEGGYHLDFYSFTQKDWETLYDTIERRDPIGMIGVKNFFYGLTGDTYVCQFSYTMPIDELKKTKAQTEDLVDQAIQKMNVQGKSDFDKVFTVNQYLCQTVYYPDAPYPAVSHTPYGALKNGCAVCEGYTSAAFLILNKLGVDCDMEFGRVHNSPPNERHVWNLVKLDGQWYQLDITWNDVDGNNANQFFLVTDDYMKQTRSWYEDSYPRCADKAYRP